MDCRKVREIVFVYADKEMDGELLVSFQQHVSVCPECARETVFAERLVTVVRSKCSRALAPEELRQRILSGLRRKPARDRGASRP